MIVPDEVLGIMAKVHPDAVETEAHDLRKAAGGIRDAGADVHTTWQGLSAFYKAPEADQLFAATTPVRDNAAMFAGQLEKVTGALTTYAAETRVIKHKLTDLYMQAVTFVNKTFNEDGNWNENKDLVNENNTLLAAVNTQAMAFHNAQEKATSSIYAAYGETTPPLPTGGGGEPPPWGTPEKADLPWYEDLWNGAGSLLTGFFGDGLGGDAKGIWDLVTSPDKWWDAYKSLMALTLPLNPIIAPFAMLIPSVRHKVNETWKGFGKSFVAWDRWKQDPARAAGNTLFNIVTTVVPVGKVGTPGKLAKLSRATAKVGDLVDPVSLSLKATKLPKVSDIVAHLGGKVGDLAKTTKLNLHKFVIQPTIDLKNYIHHRHSHIPDRIPEWIQREHRQPAAAQVRASHTPELAAARTGQPTNTIHDPAQTPATASRATPQSGNTTGGNSPGESPLIRHTGSLTGPHQGPSEGSGVLHHDRVEGDLDTPAAATPPHGPEGPPHDPSGGEHTPKLEDQVVERKDALSPKKSKPFGDGVELEANKRYIVTDHGGRYRGVFITDDHGVIREVHTWSRSTGKWRPDLRNPLPNVAYHVDDNWIFRTDDHARTISVEGELHHPGSDDARRMATDQSSAGKEGGTEYERLNKEIIDNFVDEHNRLPMSHEVDLYHDVRWNGGHLIGTAFGGPGERINLVSMLEKLNKAQKGTSLLNNYRKLESYFIAILDRSQPPRLEINIRADYLPGRKVPHEIIVEYALDGQITNKLVYPNVPPINSS
ncbi:hypothetical protein GCM10022254_23370 [Actinomadura meridiana]|uniref:Type VII secretion system protein EssD-like domain-containing protein n=1 Tax=Actinomadura meridiana TaxID=559626 RepID=A0ABP8BXR4_9ACTN